MAISMDGENTSSNWNYSDKEKAGYSQSVVGWVTGIGLVHQIDFNTKKPAYWDNGPDKKPTPKKSLMIKLELENGEERTFTFAVRAGGKDLDRIDASEWNRASDAIASAMRKVGINSRFWDELAGHKLAIKTSEDKNVWIEVRDKNGRKTGATARPFAARIFPEERDMSKWGGEIPFVEIVPDTPPTPPRQVSQAAPQVSRSFDAYADEDIPF